jgi:hypothetical protein
MNAAIFPCLTTDFTLVVYFCSKLTATSFGWSCLIIMKMLLFVSSRPHATAAMIILEVAWMMPVTVQGSWWLRPIQSNTASNMTTNSTTTTYTTTYTTTLEECAARGMGWMPSSLVTCESSSMALTREECSGCARCVCSRGNNTPSQGDSCELGDSCRMFGTCCPTVVAEINGTTANSNEEIVMYQCNCNSALELFCNAAMCPPC